MHMTVKDGVRWSTANAYLKPGPGAAQPARSSPARSPGASCSRAARRSASSTSGSAARSSRPPAPSREVILAAGSIGSPTLLQLSGIGPGQVLQEAGVPVVHELPGVGENLQDHLEVYFQYRCTQPITLNGKLDPFNKFLIGARWFFFKSGLGATNHFESCAFIRSRAGHQVARHPVPLPAGRHALRRPDAAFDGHGFQVHVGTEQAEEPRLGAHRLARPAGQAQDPVQLHAARGRPCENWRACIRLTREILAQPAMDAYRDDEIQPGNAVRSRRRDRQPGCARTRESAYHPSCTCKMGAADDPLAVLDPDCRVRGIEALRVVDSSIFPTITNGNLNGPTIMVAEKAADIILGKEPLPASNAPYYLDEEWQIRQRPGEPVRAAPTATG